MDAFIPPAESSLRDFTSPMELLCTDPASHPRKQPKHPNHPLAYSQTSANSTPPADPSSSFSSSLSSSPFLYQDTSYAMYSPWLVQVVLNLCDIRGLDWMSIAEPVERIWGVRTCAAEVLAILSSNGRVAMRRWWD